MTEVLGLKPTRERGAGGSLADVIEVILDKGLVINADITVSVAGVELLGIKIRAALTSFATAARYGLEFPSGTNIETSAWKQAQVLKESCPQCGKQVPADELLGRTARGAAGRAPGPEPGWRRHAPSPLPAV